MYGKKQRAMFFSNFCSHFVIFKLIHCVHKVHKQIVISSDIPYIAALKQWRYKQKRVFS